VSFHDDAEAQSLVDLIKDWDEARNARPSDQLRKLLKLRRQARALGGEVTAFELLKHDESPTRDVADRQWQQYTLRVYVEVIAEIWREHGGKGTGSYFNAIDGHHDGALIRLLLELFEQADIPKNRQPRRHTLHDAVLALSPPAELPQP
jgi:hypothetical protein